MKKTAIFRHNLFSEHDPGFDQVDSPARITTLYSALDELPEKAIFIEPQFSKISDKKLLLNHSQALLDMVAATAGKTYSVLDGDTFTSEKSYEAACFAAGAAVKGVDLLFEDVIANSIALVRPPGHHAEPGRAMGYCLFNNAAVAVHHAIARHGVKKVMVIDWDVHHGNGTQKSFFSRKDVLFISIHQSPLYPGTGSFLEIGEGEGEGYTINIPLPGGQGDLEYANIFNSLVIPIGLQYEPELIVVSAGFDGHHGDDISAMRLSHSGFGYMTRCLKQLADKVCGGKLIVCLEGGYNLSGLKSGVFTVLSELAGEQLNTPFPSFLDSDAYEQFRYESRLHPAIERVKEIAKNYWKI